MKIPTVVLPKIILSLMFLLMVLTLVMFHCLVGEVVDPGIYVTN
ncbi:MAG: hypothetical protein OTI34_02190 [Lewinella sp.]|jgi:hypothetical protein|nr:hypothetical protein [Lewinella sp.]